MKHKYKDLTGQRFGRLTVLSYAFSKNGQTYWKCVCDCGNTLITQRSSLIRGDTKSCGCYNADKQKTHGMRKTRLYNIWSLIKARCERETCPAYKNYGGRGIKIFLDWHSFTEFLQWSLNNGYSDDLTIDRIDVNGNYEPENCRWIPMNEQKYNKRGSLYYFGEPLKLASKRLGISYKLVWKYKKQERTVEESVLKALSTKIKKITAHIQRLRDEEGTEQEVAELINERALKVEEIKQRYPYPVEKLNNSDNTMLKIESGVI